MEVSTTLVTECPAADTFKAQLEQDVKEGKLLRYNVTCLHTFVKGANT